MSVYYPKHSWRGISNLLMFVSVCLFPCNLGGYFVLFLVEPMAGKNASLSDKQLWRFFKTFFVAE